MAFVDATGNGPDATEPSMILENVNVAEAAVADLKLVPADGATNPYAVDPNAQGTPVNQPLTGAEGQMQPGMQGGQMMQPGMQGGQMMPPGMQGQMVQPGMQGPMVQPGMQGGQMAQPGAAPPVQK